MRLVILVPVLRRPQNIEPLVKSIKENTEVCRILFLCSPNDHAEIKALRESELDYTIVPQNWENRGDYARKINIGYSRSDEEWIFMAADDLYFHPHWFENALKAHEVNDYRVVGTNDLGNLRVMRGEHSTHTLVHRAYAEQGTIDEPYKLLHEGYPHEFVDDEFIETAKKRKEFVFAEDSWVEHLHPNWGKAPMDPLYARQRQRMVNGRTLFMRRRKLWM